ncbi:hypothetical protein TKK_0008201 [Trichogramma kaykai]
MNDNKIHYSFLSESSEFSFGTSAFQCEDRTFPQTSGISNDWLSEFTSSAKEFVYNDEDTFGFSKLNPYTESSNSGYEFNYSVLKSQTSSSVLESLNEYTIGPVYQTLKNVPNDHNAIGVLNALSKDDNFDGLKAVNVENNGEVDDVDDDEDVDEDDNEDDDEDDDEDEDEDKDKDDDAFTNVKHEPENTNEVRECHSNDAINIVEEPPQRSRKRKRNPENQATKRAKILRNSGKAGLNEHGLRIQKKIMGVGCACCRFKCINRIGYNDRKKMFDEFWALKDRTRQWDYLDKYIRVRRRKKKNSKRYILMKSLKAVKVCRTMFIKTFGISLKMLATIGKKKKDGSTSITSDQRGRHHNKPNKIPEESIADVRRHIESFPTMPSHYCRKDSERIYVDQTLSIARMYDLYIDWMREHGKSNVVTEYRYSYIFSTCYNIGFHRPKKDQCDDCFTSHNLPGPEKEKAMNSIAKHFDDKFFVREQLRQDCIQAKDNPNICAASFDMQQVMNLPINPVGSLHFKKKFTNQCTGKKGANEVSTCVYHWIHAMAKTGVTDFRFYSDNYGGQNRNYIIFTMYLKVVEELQIKITHRFLVKGHTETSGDSMHSTIEKAIGKRNVYTQDELMEIMKVSKKMNHYIQ